MMMEDKAGAAGSAAHTNASSAVFHRVLTAVPPTAIGGEGCYIVDEAGRRYLDASGGAAVSCLGHGHAAINQALHAQIDAISYVHSGYFTHAPAEALARNLIAPWAGRDARAFFVSGGSEATEATIKLVRQYHLERGEPQRNHIITRRQSYHGNTLGALAISGHAPRRAPYAPYLFATRQIAPCYPYRDQHSGEDEAAYGARAAAALETEIEALGTDKVAAFFAETVCGATLGAQPAVAGYFQAIRQICDRHGVLLVLDEVMCGMGRTGTLHAFEQEGILPDIVTCAKGLGAGYQPIGAVIAAPAVVEAVRAGSGALRHGHTYMAHPLACAAALAVQETIVRDRLLPRVAALGAYLSRRLHETFGDHPHVGEIRGRGLLMAMELVADRNSKEPFDPKVKLADRLRAEAFARGLICYPSAGTVDGVKGDHVLLAPPYIATEAELDAAVEILDDALSAVLRGADT
jgi:adenosylmethionine-8-amino-7-oxononanoate aminotransferase